MKSKISALMDGELERHESDGALDALRGEGEALETWRRYHLIGDSMRDTRQLSAGFAARVTAKLADEPTVLAPKRTQPGRSDSPRWFTLSAVAASFAAVALVGWLAFAPQSPAPAPVVAKAAEKPVIVPMPSSANDYLLAHQGFSPRVSLQGMAPYVLTVAEHPAEAARK